MCFFRDSILFKLDTILKIGKEQNPSYEQKLTDIEDLLD
jgi:hypothetical protein